MAHFDCDTVALFTSFLQRSVGGQFAHVHKITKHVLNMGFMVASLLIYNVWKMNRYSDSKYRVGLMSMLAYITIHI